MSDVQVISEEGLPVTLPSGAEFKVLTTEEVDYVHQRVQRYLEDNHFVNVADFADVDRVLEMELLIHRWNLWLSRGRDYFDEPVDEGKLLRAVETWSREVRQLKNQLGIDKATRDKEKGTDSWPVYWQNLLARGREFGIMREQQSSKAIELAMQLIALVTLHDNCDEVERAELHCTVDDLVEWVRDVFIPEMTAIDAYFRENVQRYWVAEM